MGWRSRRSGKRIACAVIVAVAAVTLGLTVHHDLQFTAKVTTQQWIGVQTADVQQEECIYNAIRAQVPKGAAVYVDSPDSARAQRLAELSTLWAVPQADLATARWRLSLVPARGHCSGVALKVSRV